MTAKAATKGGRGDPGSQSLAGNSAQLRRTPPRAAWASAWARMGVSFQCDFEALAEEARGMALVHEDLGLVLVCEVADLA